MAEERDQEKTEEATQQRRDDFRRRGQVAQTKELGSVFMLIAVTGLLWGVSKFFIKEFNELFTQMFSEFIITAARNGDLNPAAAMAAKHGVIIAVPILGLLTMVGIAASIMQIGFVNNEDALEFDFERINPWNGIKRIVSLKNFAEGLKSILKLIVIVSVVYFLLQDEVNHIPQFVSLTVGQMAELMSRVTIKLLGGLGVFMAVIAAGDYFFQRWELERQMRMTKQEVKEEHKSREGDPLIKARIRRIQREMANRRMMTDVKKADVIITNPTHIACALRYDPENMAAPRLIAKGMGLIAEKIKAVARESNIPIIENKPLARTIYKTLKIGQFIPRELFTAVAQVLSYVYRLKKKVLN